MVRLLTLKDYKEMPWKNGGGMTTELFRIPTADDSAFCFRLSMAKVEQEGPFSYFQDIDRCLMLLEGNGAILKFSDEEVSFDQKLAPLTFPGESSVWCRPVDGPFTDFNVMINRNWGKFTLEREYIWGQFSSFSDLTFCFDPRLLSLTVMERGEECEIYPDGELIIIRVMRK